MVDVAELLDIPASRGRRTALRVEKRRDMESSDIASLQNGRPLEQVTPISQLRHQHHLLARLLGEGKQLTEAALITGYSVTYISRLKTQDKAFQELIQYYSDNVTEIYYSVHEMLKGLGLNTIQELMDRLATDPDSFRNRELLEMASMALDRAGYGPTSTMNVKHSTLSAEDINQLKAAIAAKSHGTVKLISPQDHGLRDSQTITIEPAREAKSPEGLESKRTGVSEESGEMVKDGGSV